MSKLFYPKPLKGLQGESNKKVFEMKMKVQFKISDQPIGDRKSPLQGI